MGLKQITAPDIEPVTVETAKAHLRITHDDEDALLRLYIKSARRWVENYTHRALISQQWQYTMDRFPWGFTPIILPLGKIIAVDQIDYIDLNEVTQTLRGPTSGSPAGTDYQEDLSNDNEGRILPNASDDWPEADDERLAAVTVTFTAGFGTKAENVPEDIVSGMLFRLADLYEFRGSMDGQGTENAKRELDHWVIPLA